MYSCSEAAELISLNEFCFLVLFFSIMTTLFFSLFLVRAKIRERDLSRRASTHVGAIEGTWNSHGARLERRERREDGCGRMWIMREELDGRRRTLQDKRRRLKGTSESLACSSLLQEDEEEGENEGREGARSEACHTPKSRNELWSDCEAELEHEQCFEHDITAAGKL